MKDSKYFAHRFAIVEAYFKVLDYEYYGENKVDALKRVIEELGHISHHLYGVDAQVWKKYFIFKFDLETPKGIFDTEKVLRADYQKMLDDFKGGNY